MKSERNPIRELYLRVTFNEEWKDYSDVHPELLFEDSGIMDGVKDSVGIEIIGPYITPEPTQVTDEEIDKAAKRHFHGFSDEQWEELKTTFPFVEIPFIVRDVLAQKNRK